MPKYLEEAAGAAEYVTISSPLMTTHLKNSLLQVNVSGLVVAVQVT